VFIEGMEVFHCFFTLKMKPNQTFFDEALPIGLGGGVALSERHIHAQRLERRRNPDRQQQEEDRELLVAAVYLFIFIIIVLILRV